MKLTQQKLNSKHQDELKASGLTNLSNLAYFSGDRAWVKEHIGYNMEGLVIPYLDPLGNPYRRSDGKDFYRFKPEWGDKASDDKPKYLSPKEQGSRPYFPQSIDWTSVFNSRKISIYFTEGEKKADRMAQAGYASIGLPGVYGWLDSCPRPSEDDLDATRVIPELAILAELGIFKGREVPIVFDSDITQKWQVQAAIKALAGWIEEQGGHPSIVLLPTEPNREKNGADDFMVRHGELAYAEIVYHATPAFYRDRSGKRQFNSPSKPMLETKLALTESVLADRWKYRPNFGWYQWSGKYWRLLEDGTNTMISKDIYAVFDANKWTGQTRSAINDVLSKLRPRLSETDGWNPTSLIAFSNGVLETKTQKFTPHSHQNLITTYLPYQYAPGLTCNKWLEFLNQALGQDQDAIELVRAFFRWALTPKATGKLAIECAWDLFGEPGRGKGTVLETLRNLVGRENSGTFRGKYLSNPNVAAALLDKKVSICSDSTGAIDDPGLYNEIVSNEPVAVKFLYKNIINTTLNTFLVRAYNSVPPTPFGSQGLDRRIVAMAFKHQPETKDIHLQQKINAELSGIFNWVWSMSEVEMVERIATAGKVQAVIEASVKRFEMNNPAFVFLQRVYPDGLDRIHPKELYKKYDAWSFDHNEKPLGYKNFVVSIEGFGASQSETALNGYKDFSIPAMKDFDIIAYLGIDHGSKQSINKSLDKLGDSLDTHLELTANSLSPKPGTEQGFEKPSELVKTARDLTTIEKSQLFDLEEYDIRKTSPLADDEIGATGWDDLPAPKPPNLDRPLGETVLTFNRKLIAAEWESYLNVNMGVNAWKPKKVVVIGGRNTWQVRVINLSPEQIEQLSKIDPEASPPRTPIWSR
jgi:putative DNA primase/helicase